MDILYHIFKVGGTASMAAPKILCYVTPSTRKRARGTLGYVQQAHSYFLKTRFSEKILDQLVQ